METLPFLIVSMIFSHIRGASDLYQNAQKERVNKNSYLLECTHVHNNDS